MTARAPLDLDILPIPGMGPEDVLLGADGLVLCGVADGRILGRWPDGQTQEMAQTGGRPLGLDWLPDGRLLVCDADRGVLAIDLSAPAPEVLCDAVEGQALTLCNNASVTPDGTVWFTSSSARFGLDAVTRDIVGHTCSGTLNRLSPGCPPERVLGGLAFANGVAHLPGPEGDRILVAATGAAAITALWITGPQAGRAEPFAQDLPLMPDNLSLGSDGLIWAGGPNRTDSGLRIVHRLPAPLRAGIGALAQGLGAGARPMVGVMGFDGQGRMVHHIETTHPQFRTVTGVREAGGTVWLGSVESRAIARFSTP